MTKIEQRLSKIEARHQKRKKAAPLFTPEEFKMVWSVFEASGNDIHIQPPDHFTWIHRAMLDALIQLERDY